MVYYIRGEHINNYTADVIAKVMKAPSETAQLRSLFQFSSVRWFLRKGLNYKKVYRQRRQMLMTISI